MRKRCGAAVPGISVRRKVAARGFRYLRPSRSRRRWAGWPPPSSRAFSYHCRASVGSGWVPTALRRSSSIASNVSPIARAPSARPASAARRKKRRAEAMLPDWRRARPRARKPSARSRSALDMGARAGGGRPAAEGDDDGCGAGAGESAVVPERGGAAAAGGGVARGALASGAATDGGAAPCPSAAAATTRLVFASATMPPSTAITVMVMSLLPEAPAGMTIRRPGRDVTGTAHAPGAMTWPSVSAIWGLRPRMRT